MYKVNTINIYIKYIKLTINKKDKKEKNNKEY